MPNTNIDIAKAVSGYLECSRKKIHSLRLINTSLAILTLLAGGLATLLGAGAAISGQVVLGTGPSGWKITCGIVAILSFIATLATGIKEQFQIAQELSKSQICSGQLRSLELELASGSPIDMLQRNLLPF